jgi:hypothetical protein
VDTQSTRENTFSSQNKLKAAKKIFVFPFILSGRVSDQDCQATFKNDHLRQIKMTSLVIAFH